MERLQIGQFSDVLDQASDSGKSRPLGIGAPDECAHREENEEEGRDSADDHADDEEGARAGQGGRETEHEGCEDQEKEWIAQALEEVSHELCAQVATLCQTPHRDRQAPARFREFEGDLLGGAESESLFDQSGDEPTIQARCARGLAQDGLGRHASIEGGRGVFEAQGQALITAR